MHGFTTRVDGHEPDDIHAQRVQPVQLLLCGLEGSLSGEGPDVQVVDDAVFRCDRLRVVNLKGARRLAACCQKQQGQGKKQVAPCYYR